MAVMENRAYAQRAGAMIQHDAGPLRGAGNHDQLHAQGRPGGQPRLPDRSPGAPHPPPCSVKLLFVPDPPERGYPEARWVRVTAMADGTYTGTLVSHPSPSKDLPGCGDLVTFQGRHIITVMP